MSKIIEIVFENIDIYPTSKLIAELGKIHKILNMTYDSTLSELGIDVKDNNSIVKYFEQSSNKYIFINLDKLLIENVYFYKASLQLYSYEKIIDFTIILDIEYCKEKITIKSLNEFSKSVSMKVKSNNFYCGLEPASDEDTRFFTNNIIGPLQL